MEWVTNENALFKDTLSTTPPENERKHIEVLLALDGRAKRSFYHGECRNVSPHSPCGIQLDIIVAKYQKYNTTKEEDFVVLVKPCTRHLQDYIRAGWEEL